MLDEYPDHLYHRRELFVLCLVVVCFLGSLSTLTNVSSFSKLKKDSNTFKEIQLSPRDAWLGVVNRRAL